MYNNTVLLLFKTGCLLLWSGGWVDWHWNLEIRLTQPSFEVDVEVNAKFSNKKVAAFLLSHPLYWNRVVKWKCVSYKVFRKSR